MSLKKYKKIKYLGQGSYGAAILVSLKSNPHEQFVIKEIVIGHLKESEQQLTQNEVDVLKQMNHSNIAMYIESFVENSKLYIVMEYADGGDLSHAIQRKKKLNNNNYWNEDEVMRIFVQICLALKHVHDRNIIHRDLKSQNIFLTSKGIVKLGDFGIAKVLDATGDQARTQIGTPYYLSPEICDNKLYDTSSDIWSLGVILYELLCLELPFTAQSLPALVIKICSSDPSWVKIETSYSSQILALTRQTLMKNPKKRPTVKEIVNTNFVITHISKLLSYTLKMGKGGAESAIENTNQDDEERIDPDIVDQNIEKERERQKREEQEQLRVEREKQIQYQRQQQRLEEREKLKKFRLEANARRKNKEDGEEDVVYAPPIRQSSYSESSSEGYVPTGALERNKAVRERDVQGENSHVAEYVSQPHRVPKPAPIVDHQSNYYDIKAKASAADHNPYSNRDKPRGQAAAAIPTVQAVKAHSAQNDYESIVTRDFIENRKAAQAFKARLQQYERDADVGKYFGGEARHYQDDQGESSTREQVKAKRERERELEMAEKERQLRQAYEETRLAKARLEEQRKRQAQLGAFGRADIEIKEKIEVQAQPPTPQNTPHSFENETDYERESRYERERRKEKEREEELRKHQEALKKAAEETRKQQKAIRREPIAFQVEFDNGNNGVSVEKIERKKDPVSAPVSRERDRERDKAKASSSNDGIRRSVDDGIDPNKSLTKGSRPKRESIYRDNVDKNKQSDGVPPGLLAHEAKARQRKGWGRPIDPFNPSPPQQQEVTESSSIVGKEDPGDIETQMDSGILQEVFGESLARELKEGEESVLKVLEARHGREEMARINAKEKFRLLREKQKQDAYRHKQRDAVTPDRQIRKHLAVKSAVEDQSPSPKEITTTSTATVTSSSISQPPPSNRANRLNDILGMVQNAQNEVQNALKYRPGAIRNSPSPSYTPTTPPPSNTENHSKSSERRKQLANDEMFAYSSEDDDDQETNRDHEKKFKTTMKEQVVEKEHEDENDLEKTLDNWLTKQRKKEKEMKLSSSSSISRRGDSKVTDLRNERIHQEEEDEDDGGVADLQCMLADVLMSSGEEQLQLDEKEKSQRSRFNIL